MTSADVRHFQRMQAVITAIRSGTVTLVAGAGSLHFLHNALSQSDEAWDGQFNNHALTLESAGIPLQGKSEGLKVSDPIVTTALDALEVLIRQRLAKNLSPEEAGEDL